MVTELTEGLKKAIVVSGPSKAYDVLAENVWVRLIIPQIRPLPERVVVIVSVLELVLILPVVMVSVPILISLAKVSTAAEVLLTITVLKVVAPVIVVFEDVVKLIVLVDAIKVPKLLKLPVMVCEKVEASKVAGLFMIRLVFTVIMPPGVFVPPLDEIRLE